MKQLTFLLSLAVLLLMGSCAKEDPFSIDSGEKVIYKFTAQLPGYIQSRAIGDGKKANELFFWVFDENNNELTELRQHNIAFDNSTGRAKVEVSLTPGHTYSFAFWAQNKECKVYDPNNSDRITIDYTGEAGPIIANDDMRDAFYALEKNISVNTEGQTVERTIKLRRPFSQLNYGISEEALDAITAAGFDLTGATTKVYISNAYTQFGILAGQPIEIDDNHRRVVFQHNGMPKGIPNDILRDVWWLNDPNDEDSGELKDFVWLSFNYFLTTLPIDQDHPNSSTINTWIEIVTANGTTFKSPTFDNIVVQGNNRTNILVDFFTEEVTFNVVIDQLFDDYDHNVDLTINPIASSQDPNPKAPLKSNIANYNGISIPTFIFK